CFVRRRRAPVPPCRDRWRRAAAESDDKEEERPRRAMPRGRQSTDRAGRASAARGGAGIRRRPAPGWRPRPRRPATRATDTRRSLFLLRGQRLEIDVDLLLVFRRRFIFHAGREPIL